MQETDEVYLIARFSNAAQLQQAAQSLLAADVAHNHLAVLGGGTNGAQNVAGSLGLQAELSKDIELDTATAERLRWHQERGDGPMLAVRVMAAQGRDIRHRLTQLGGDMLDAPNLDMQANDLDVDPGMPKDPLELPTYGRLSDNNSPTGVPEDE
jgi:hypothetical protein